MDGLQAKIKRAMESSAAATAASGASAAGADDDDSSLGDLLNSSGSGDDDASLNLDGEDDEDDGDLSGLEDLADEDDDGLLAELDGGDDDDVLGDDADAFLDGDDDVLEEDDDDDLDFSDEEEDVAAVDAGVPAPAAKPKPKKSSTNSARGSASATTRAAARSMSARTSASPKSARRRATPRKTQSKTLKHINGKGRTNVWSGAGSVNSRHELKYGEARLLVADMAHQRLSRDDRLKAQSSLFGGLSPEERTARREQKKSEHAQKVAEQSLVFSVKEHLKQFKSAEFGEGTKYEATGDCAVAGERLYLQATDARKRLSEQLEAKARDEKEEHRKYCKMSEKSAELLRRAAKKNGGGRTDLQAQQTSTRDVTQATFKKMLKRLKYEMKECTFKPKTTWKEYQREQRKNGRQHSGPSGRKRAAGAHVDLDHLKVEDRLIEKGQLAMRQLIRDRAKAATDKMKECENEGGHLFAPEIIPIVPSVRKAMQAHKKKKTGKKGKIRRRARTAKARKKVFSRLYGDAKKKTRNIQKLRRKQIEEEMMQNTHQPTISHLARVTGTYDRSGDETSTPIHIRLNREHLSRKERSESAARSAALAKVEAEMEHCTFAPTFKGSAKSVKRMIKATRGMRRSKAAAAVAAESPPPPADEEDDDDAPPPADEDEEVEFEEVEVEEEVEEEEEEGEEEYVTEVTYTETIVDADGNETVNVTTKRE